MSFMEARMARIMKTGPALLDWGIEYPSPPPRATLRSWRPRLIGASTSTPSPRPRRAPLH